MNQQQKQPWKAEVKREAKRPGDFHEIWDRAARQYRFVQYQKEARQ